MATSRFKTLQYAAENFVESAGAILFHRSSRRICLIHHQEKDEWLLAKGRRDIGEALSQTAIREATEETGFACRLLPVTMASRAPPALEGCNSPDEIRTHAGVCEPFMITCRLLQNDQNLKIITWYIAEVDEDSAVGEAEEGFQAWLFGFEDSLERLTFELDRDIVRKAISIFEKSYKSSPTTEVISC